MSEILAVFASIECKDDCLEQVLQELLAIVDTTLAEEGCLHYQVHRDIDNDKRIHVYEHWRSKADMKAHMAMPHFIEFGKKTKGMIEKVSARRMAMVTP